jgi:hypothetical protein
MKSMMLLSAALCGLALGQGDLNPPGSPAPTMKSLQEIWDKAVNLEAQNLAQQQQISALTQKNNEQNAYLGILLEKSGVSLPWKLANVDSVGTQRCNSALAFAPNGQPAICYYDGINQDLKYAVFNGVSWQATPVDSAGNVGSFNSLAFTPAGRPAIAYYDSTNGDLKYAAFDGSTWQITPVDTADNVGVELSLKMSPAGRPAISYYDSTNQDLKFASFDGTSWTAVTVDSAGNVGSGPSLAFSASGTPSISYGVGPAAGIKYAEFVTSSWVVTPVYNAGVAEDVAGSSLAISPSGLSYIAFETYSGGADIKLAKRSNTGGWSTSVIPRPLISAADWGFSPFLGFTPDGQPAMSITQDPASSFLGLPNLRYLSFDGTDWKIVNADTAPLVGFDSSLAFGPGGQPAISYYDKTNGKIKYAVRSVFQNP